MVINIRAEVKTTPIRILRVEWPEGHQVVVGGRLMSQTANGVTTPYYTMPEYTRGDFPSVFDEWEPGEVAVYDVTRGKQRLEQVKACRLLFRAHDSDDVTDWLLSHEEEASCSTD